MIFKVGTSLVAVCDHCKTVVGRGDRGLESLGKVADLVETLSPLALGTQGNFAGLRFELVGRTQFRHPAGGVWDEWYAAFGDGRWGWLAEAMGRFFLTFEEAAPPDLPLYDRIGVGQRVHLRDTDFQVAEKNIAQVGSLVGEVPRRVTPGTSHPFADLSGPQSLFGTLDYSGPTPHVYLGREVTLDELGIPPEQRRTYPGLEPTIAAVRLNCPQCGGGLELRAPDRSERVGCPYCGALLDVKEGNLRLFQSLKKPTIEPIIPLGSKGMHPTIEGGIEWTCLGFLRRVVTFEGVDYYWEEYLLYQPRHGFRWLVRSDDHWTWVRPIPPGSVEGDGLHARYAGRWYRLFQKARARVTLVYGECYWKVQVGEEVLACDYVSAPYSLSLEQTRGAAGEKGEGEINWSHGTYVQPSAVRAMFQLPQPLPEPAGIGPTQPFPYSGVYRQFVYLAVALVLLGLAWWAVSPAKVVFEESFALPAIAADQAEKTVTLEREIGWRGGENARITLQPQGAEWVGVRGVLVSDGEVPEPGQTGARSPPARQSFSFWSEPASSDYVYLSAMPGGRYTLQLTFGWEKPEQPTRVNLRIRQGVAHLSPLVIVLLLLAVVPVCVGIYELIWESRRWGESNPQGDGG
jgi:hypothetical protein